MARVTILYGLYLALRSYLEKNKFSLEEFFLRFMNNLVPAADLEDIGKQATRFVSYNGHEFLGELLSDEELRTKHEGVVEKKVFEKKPKVPKVEKRRLKRQEKQLKEHRKA